MRHLSLNGECGNAFRRTHRSHLVAYQVAAHDPVIAKSTERVDSHLAALQMVPAEGHCPSCPGSYSVPLDVQLL
jgi:hypothetical protein